MLTMMMVVKATICGAELMVLKSAMVVTLMSGERMTLVDVVEKKLLVLARSCFAIRLMVVVVVVEAVIGAWLIRAAVRVGVSGEIERVGHLVFDAGWIQHHVCWIGLVLQEIKNK